MIVCVCGSRSWRDDEKIRARLAEFPRGTTIMHGNARGADKIAGQVADSLGFPVAIYPAEWRKYGRRAGHVRNAFMASLPPDWIIAFWDGRSTGTRSMIDLGRKRGIPVEVIEP